MPAPRNGGKAPAAPPARPTVSELVELAVKHDLAELEVEQGGTRIRVVRERSAPAAAPPAGRSPGGGAPRRAAETAIAANLVKIEAPMVGTFYHAPAPDAAPFVQEGDVVKDGQVLCIIEAMKLMNEIEAKVAGRIARVLVENGQPVEFGQALFLIDPRGVVSRVPQDPHRQSRRDRAPRDPDVPRDGHPHRDGPLHRGRGLAPRPARRRVDLYRPGRVARSYLNIPSIISAASITDSEAIHPATASSSENAAFAEICRACGITFIGPSPEAIRLMGDKAQARRDGQGGGRAGGAGQRRPLPGRGRCPGPRRPRGLPGHAQGRRGRRRARDADRARPRGAAARLRHLPGGGAEGVLVVGALPREVRGRGAPRRGPGDGRQERHPRAHGRARLLGAAAPPEARRGVPRAVHLRGDAGGTDAGRPRGGQRGELRLRGHRRVPGRARRAASTSSR